MVTIRRSPDLKSSTGATTTFTRLPPGGVRVAHTCPEFAQSSARRPCATGGSGGSALLRRLDRLPHPVGSRRHVDVVDAEVRERVDARFPARGRRADGAGLADAL